ncbi:MAG: hypothetical protein U0T69_04670 [Chitinophagales bacterium]
MKTNKTIRSIVAMMVIFFAVTATSCKKENEITPETPQAPTAPGVPNTPVIPAVSMKPVSIITTENGSAVRKQVYNYNAQGKLIRYESLAGANASDSVVPSNNSIAFFKHGSSDAIQVLTLNTDKTFKSLFLRTSQADFVNNQNQLNLIQQTRPDGSILTAAEFAYVGNNLNAIGGEIRININYYNNLPYQKGINEIPVIVKPIKFYKLMEQENITTTLLYNKLIHQVIIQSSASRFETHEFTYVFDSNNRVTQITDVITVTTSTSSAQKVLVSTVSY